VISLRYQSIWQVERSSWKIGEDFAGEDEQLEDGGAAGG
jgi:hypothetical protein